MVLEQYLVQKEVNVYHGLIGRLGSHWSNGYDLKWWSGLAVQFVCKSPEFMLVCGMIHPLFWFSTWIVYFFFLLKQSSYQCKHCIRIVQQWLLKVDLRSKLYIIALVSTLKFTILIIDWNWKGIGRHCSCGNLFLGDLYSRAHVASVVGISFLWGNRAHSPFSTHLPFCPDLPCSVVLVAYFN